MKFVPGVCVCRPLPAHRCWAEAILSHCVTKYSICWIHWKILIRLGFRYVSNRHSTWTMSSKSALLRVCVCDGMNFPMNIFEAFGRRSRLHIQYKYYYLLIFCILKSAWTNEHETWREEWAHSYKREQWKWQIDTFVRTHESHQCRLHCHHGLARLRGGAVG